MNQKMHQVYSDIKALSDLDLMACVSGMNTTSYMDTLRNEYECKAEEIWEFFDFVCKECLKRGVPLRHDGFMDLVKYAGERGLLMDQKMRTFEGAIPQ